LSISVNKDKTLKGAKGKNLFEKDMKLTNIASVGKMRSSFNLKACVTYCK